MGIERRNKYRRRFKCIKTNNIIERRIITMSKKMKAAVMYGPNDIRIEEVDKPDCPKGDLF